MEVIEFCPPVDVRFHMGSSQDSNPAAFEESAQRRKFGRGHRPSNKNRLVKSVRLRREILQKTIASRSSALRQGKLAEARTGPHSNEFEAVQEAAKKACSSPIFTTKLAYINARKRRKITSSRGIQHETPYSAVSRRNMNTSILFDSNIAEIKGPANEDNPTGDNHH